LLFINGVGYDYWHTDPALEKLMGKSGHSDRDR
jgi:hypothetical protein